VALAFEAQLVDELPCEPHDLAVGAIVTEARVIRTR
jgi:5-formyltetrahydrofolate cyclo-ligase